MLCWAFSLYVSVYCQIPPRRIPPPNTSSTQIDVDKGKVDQIINQAEGHFKNGQSLLKEKKATAARAEFDLAVDTILESGLNVNTTPRLKIYYLQLVERIYREEIPLPQDSTLTPSLLKEQKFEPSPLDELSQLVLSSDEVPLEIAQNRCTPGTVERIELRGLRLGMPLAQVKAKIAALKVRAPDRFGLAKAFVNFKQTKSVEPFKGVTAIAFDFFNARLSYIGIIYDNSITWDSSDEFVRQISTVLKLPHQWEPSQDKYGLTSYELKELECEGSKFIAGFERYGYTKYPVMHWLDMSAVRQYVNRKLDEEEKKRKLEEQRRRTFKP